MSVSTSISSYSLSLYVYCFVDCLPVRVPISSRVLQPCLGSFNYHCCSLCHNKAVCICCVYSIPNKKNPASPVHFWVRWLICGNSCRDKWIPSVIYYFVKFPSFGCAESWSPHSMLTAVVSSCYKFAYYCK